MTPVPRPDYCNLFQLRETGYIVVPPSRLYPPGLYVAASFARVVYLQLQRLLK